MNHSIYTSGEMLAHDVLFSIQTKFGEESQKKYILISRDGRNNRFRKVIPYTSSTSVVKMWSGLNSHKEI